MRYGTRVVGGRLVRTVEIGAWRISMRRATVNWRRWQILRDNARAYVAYLPFVVVTALGRR